jgi:hypothetical protein
VDISRVEGIIHRYASSQVSRFLAVKNKGGKYGTGKKEIPVFGISL